MRVSPVKGLADQTECDMDRLDRAGLRQDSQKRLQQESVLAYAGISHLSHEYGVLLHFEYCCNLNKM